MRRPQGRRKEDHNEGGTTTSRMKKIFTAQAVFIGLAVTVMVALTLTTTPVSLAVLTPLPLTMPRVLTLLKALEAPTTPVSLTMPTTLRVSLPTPTTQPHYVIFFQTVLFRLNVFKLDPYWKKCRK